VQVTSTQTQSATIRVQRTRSYQITSTARFQASAVVTITAAGRVQVSSAHTQDASARLQLIASKYTYADARVQVHREADTYSDSRVQASVVVTQYSDASIAIPAQQYQSADAVIRVVSARSLNSDARVQKSVSSTQLARAAVRVVGVLRTIQSSARLTGLFPKKVFVVLEQTRDWVMPSKESSWKVLPQVNSWIDKAETSWKVLAQVRKWIAQIKGEMMFTGTKDPNSTEDFEIDWVNRASGDAIVESTWTADTPMVVETDSILGTKTRVRLSGGTAGKTLKAKNTVTLTSGQILEATIALRIEDQ
jgi:hypothetical protein